MRASEFTKPTVTESDHMDADQVLQYVKKTHAPGEFNIEYSITDHPAWELKNIPISQLNLDPDGEEQDPYNRTNWVDYDVVRDLMPKIAQVLKAKPIVVDSNGWIIDGNHRAMAAAEAGLTSVPALVPAQQDMAENKAAGITKAFNSLGDPVFANLQRVALLAMQGRQSEAAGRLQTVIKHADSAVQKKITDAVNNIKPVTINGRVADSSTLDKSKQHNDWITNTFIPWVQSLLGHQDVTEAKTVEFEGLTLKVIKNGHELTVDALDEWGNKVLGHVKFNIGDGRELDPQDLRVDDKYQGQGIARVMYDYVKSLGYTINRSWDQTDAGAGFWNKHRGEDVRVWEQGVAEGKITLSTDPNWYGATVDNYQASGPVVNIPANQLVGFEPDDKMNQPKSKVNVEKIVAGLKQGAKLPPLLVRKYKNGYQVLDGHHRFWAYKLLSVKSIPAQIVPDSDIEEISKQGVAENFADGKNPGRKGLAKRSGVDTKASVSSLRNTAKHSSGEKQRMSHWLANMKAGRAKAKRK